MNQAKIVCELYFEDTHPDQDCDQIFLYVHGNCSTSYFWKPLIKEIAKSNPDIRQVSVDLRGFGRSQQIPHFDSLHELALDLKHFIEKKLLKGELEVFVKKLTIIGHSFGGCVIQRLAVDFPQYVGKIVFVSSGSVAGMSFDKLVKNQINIYCIKDGGQMRCEIKEEVAENIQVSRMLQIFENKDRQTLEEIFRVALFNSGKVPNKEVLNALLDETFLQTNYLDTAWALHNHDISGGKEDTAKTIKGPILVYHGQLDMLVPLIQSQGILVEIGPEKCKLVVNENVGHMGQFEDPEHLCKTILEFVLAE